MSLNPPKKQIVSNNMKIFLKIDGGIGKSIAATAVCKAIKAQYPDCKLYIITGYPDVFEGNRLVYETMRHDEQNYFYQSYNGSARY